jgi:hypothetical protein
MIRADEIRPGDAQIQFSLAALQGVRLQPKSQNVNAAKAIAQPASRPNEITLSGPQVLAGVIFALSFMTLFAWGFVRYWLFAP